MCKSRSVGVRPTNIVCAISRTVYKPRSAGVRPTNIVSVSSGLLVVVSLPSPFFVPPCGISVLLVALAFHHQIPAAASPNNTTAVSTFPMHPPFASSASTTSPQLAKRFSGFFASAFASTAFMRLEIPGTGLTGAVNTACPSTTGSSPSNGNSPANIQYASTPKEYSSDAECCGHPSHCSGDL